MKSNNISISLDEKIDALALKSRIKTLELEK